MSRTIPGFADARRFWAFFHRPGTLMARSNSGIRSCLGAAAFVALLNCFLCQSTSAVTPITGNYTYKILYDQDSVAPLDGYTLPSLNDAGVVAFEGVIGSNRAIFKGDGGEWHEDKR